MSASDEERELYDRLEMLDTLDTDELTAYLINVVALVAARAGHHPFEIAQSLASTFWLAKDDWTDPTMSLIRDELAERREKREAA